MTISCFLILFKGNGTYLVSYTPELNGKHDIYVTIQDKPIKDSPFNVLVINRREYNEVGLTLMRFGQYGSKKKEFKSPFGVACDQSGHIYVADSYNHRVQIFGKKGEFVHFFGAHGERKGIVYLVIVSSFSSKRCPSSLRLSYIIYIQLSD